MTTEGAFSAKPSRKLLCGLVVVAILMAGCGGENESDVREAGNVEVQDASWKEGPTVATSERLPCTTAEEPANFPIYSLGPEFDGLPLTAVLRRCDKPYPGEPIRANSVSLIYGTCEVEPDPETGFADGGCAPPLEVQSSPACERTFADVGEPGAVKALAELRGVPASGAVPGVEIYSGSSTIVVHSGSDLARRAVEALVEVPTDTPPASIASLPATQPSGDLPSPVPGVLHGGVDCEG